VIGDFSEAMILQRLEITKSPHHEITHFLASWTIRGERPHEINPKPGGGDPILRLGGFVVFSTAKSPDRKMKN